jgi:predicted GIY-YIG superfamily endonuclease
LARIQWGLSFFMGAYQRINLIEISCFNSIQRTSDISYAYIMTSKYTGHFYVGQTTSIKDRIYAHAMVIMKLAEGIYTANLHFHRIVAEAIKKEKQRNKKNREMKIERFVREAFSVHIVAVADKECIDLVENYYIRKLKSDEKCLNLKWK